jgi:hypothetical protein
MTYTEKWFYQEHIDRYEKLEKAGKLGAKSAEVLAFWRKAKVKYPNLISVSRVNGRLGVSNPGA